MRLKSKFRDLKEWYWDNTNRILERHGHKWRFNHNKGELRYRLEQRGVLEEVENKLEKESCKCGASETVGELASVSKTPNPHIDKGYELLLRCKECYR